MAFSLSKSLVPQKIEGIFHNKFVLYIVLFIALINIVSYLAYRDFDMVAFFVLIGLLTSFFSKNMIVILLVAIVMSSLFKGVKLVGNSREGMENKEEGADADANADADADANAGADADATADDKADAKANDEGKEAGVKAKEPTKEKKDGAATKQGMQNLSPAKYSHDDKDSDDVRDVNRVDYSSTLSAAYSNLQNLLGDDGMKNLTDQTKSLMSEQKKLMDSMKSIEPLVNTAQGFMNQLSGNGGLASITKMLGGLGGAKDSSAA